MIPLRYSGAQIPVSKMARLFIQYLTINDKENGPKCEKNTQRTLIFFPYTELIRSSRNWQKTLKISQSRKFGHTATMLMTS